MIISPTNSSITDSPPDLFSVIFNCFILQSLFEIKIFRFLLNYNTTLKAFAINPLVKILNDIPRNSQKSVVF